MPKILTIAYTGTVLGSSINPNTWDVWGVNYDRGFPAFKPQLELETLQAFAIDGARYRVGGLHYPQFQMTTIIPATDYFQAGIDARNLEQVKGDTITLTYEGLSQRAYTFYVLDIKAVPNARRIIGAVGQASGTLEDPEFNNPTYGSMDASLDVIWNLQGYAP